MHFPIHQQVRGQITYMSLIEVNSVAAPEFFFLWGGIEGAKCDSEGAKIQIFAKNGLFWPFFSSDWGQVGGAEPLTGGKMPPCPSPPPLMPPLGKLVDYPITK